MRTNYRSERLRLGLTLEEAAKGIGVRPDELRKWEDGDDEPYAQDLRRIAMFYGCSPDYLLGIKECR